MLQVHEDQSKHIIQVDRIMCVGVPIGSTEFIKAFVTNRTSAMVADAKKLRVPSDPLTHTRLTKFCHNALLSQSEFGPRGDEKSGVWASDGQPGHVDGSGASTLCN